MCQFSNFAVPFLIGCPRRFVLLPTLLSNNRMNYVSVEEELRLHACYLEMQRKSLFASTWDFIDACEDVLTFVDGMKKF